LVILVFWATSRNGRRYCTTDLSSVIRLQATRKIAGVTKRRQRQYGYQIGRASAAARADRVRLANRRAAAIGRSSLTSTDQRP